MVTPVVGMQPSLVVLTVVPEGHVKQVASKPYEYSLEEHAEQLELLAAAYSPGAHCVQLDAPPELEVPAGQSVHEADPAAA